MDGPQIQSISLQSLRIFWEIMLKDLLKARQIRLHPLVYSFSFIYWTNHLIIEVNKSGQVWFALDKRVLAVPSHFLIIRFLEMEHLLHNLPKVQSKAGQAIVLAPFWNLTLHLSLFSPQGPLPITSTYRRSQWFHSLMNQVSLNEALCQSCSYHSLLHRS